MAGPLAIPIAEKGISIAKNKAEDVLKNDLLTFQGQHFRRVVIQKKRRKSKRYPEGQEEIVILEPLNWTAHINPVTIGIGGIVATIAAFGAYIMWNGVTTGGIGVGRAAIRILPGLKEGGYWDDRVERHVDCVNQHRDFRAALARGDITSAQGIYDNAKTNSALLCSWTHYVRRP